MCAYLPVVLKVHGRKLTVRVALNLYIRDEAAISLLQQS